MTNNFNLPEAPIQNDDGILTFSHENTEFVVDVNSEKSREKCSEELNRISGKHYEWCKETEGKNHWVLYDTAMYSKVYGGDDYNALTYNFGCGLAPIIPINATSCSAMFEKCEDILDLSQFNTHNIVTMSDMFAYYRGTELDVSMLDAKCDKALAKNTADFSQLVRLMPKDVSFEIFVKGKLRESRLAFHVSKKLMHDKITLTIWDRCFGIFTFIVEDLAKSHQGSENSYTLAPAINCLCRKDGNWCAKSLDCKKSNCCVERFCDCSDGRIQMAYAEA